MSQNASEKIWTGDEWERYVQNLLKQHYGADYQEIPDIHCGDFGLEGFASTDATAYQCYAVEGLVDADTLYTRQRNKITADLAKFAQNRDDLVRLFGNLRIERWVLVVPYYTSAKLVQHATRKSAEIRSLGLPYAADNFEVRIVTDDAFAVARATLATAGIAAVTLAAPEVADSDFDTWCNENSALLSRMSGKLKRLPGLVDDAKRREAVTHFTKSYLRGQAVLATLRDDFPELYERVLGAKGARERILEIESLAGGGAPSQVLRGELALLEASLATVAPSLSKATTSHLVLEAVTDWLIRCPLDFTGGHE